MGAAYDNYKFTEANEKDLDLDRFNQLVADKLKSLEQEIAWNINRLSYLVLSDEDRQQTEDYIMDLRQERESLKRCFNAS